ncbi:MAG: efflux RND transporter permease subunit [Planctomycetes bacterium]|nr:efflux RND transporter permease subunit [Planctomycetota bacterium]
MLTRVVDASLQHRAVVLLLTGLLVVAGLVALRDLPLDAFPDTTPVQVTVNTVAPNLSPEEVERQITFPVEQVLSGLPGLLEVRSISKFALSQVTLIFEDGSDVWRARQVVGERLHEAALPDGVGPPVLGPVATGLGEAFHYLVRGEGKTLEELRTAHDWIVRPQLRSVRGVAEVNAWGGAVKQVHVVVDPDLLVKHDLTCDDVVDALRQNNQSAGGGVLTAPSGEAMLVQGLGLASTTDDVAGIVLKARDGAPVRVRDVAKVEEGHEVRRGAVTADGRGEVVLGLGFVLSGENGRAVTLRLAERLEQAKKSLPPGIEVEPVYQRTTLVDQVLETVRTNLLEGALLVVAVLFVFLGSVRAGLIVALAIPLSMLCAFDLMLRAGVAGSLMSLGAIDFGLVVDSSVIMVENAKRRLDEDRSGRSVLQVVRDAAVEVRRPTLFGEMIIAIVYLPILTLEGVEGKLFRPMALTVIFALVGSMVLSLTLMPVLASLGLRRGGDDERPRLVRALEALYRPVLRAALDRPLVVLAVACLALGGGSLLATRLGAEFVPRLREGAIVINTVRLASVSLEESVRYGLRIEQVLQEAFPDEVERVWTRTGTAEVATDPMGVELSDVFVTLRPRAGWTKARTQDDLVRAMSAVVGRLPGMRAIFSQPIEMRVNEMIAGIRGDLGVKLFGDDLEVLREKAQEVAAVIARVPGAADVAAEQVTGAPVLRITVDREACSRLGVPVSHVLDAVAMVGTKVVGEVIQGQQRFDLAVRLDPRYRTDPVALGRVLVAAPGGERVALSRLARMEVVDGPSTVHREWGRRRVVVQANARGRDVAGFVADVEAALAEHVPLPPGYHVDFGGQFEHLVRARRRLLVVVPLALGLVLALLYLTYGRLVDALRVFTGVPLAAVGGVAALWLRGLPFSISAAVGFVALCGVSVLADMVLVSTIRQRLADGLPLREAVEQAAIGRLRPVLMTSLVASLGFLPMALNTGVGAEVQRPLATVVIGGVLTSTALTLVVLPVLYAALGRRSGAPTTP